MFIDIATKFIKKNPFKDFLLRISNKPLPRVYYQDDLVWALNDFSIYRESVGKAKLRVMVRSTE